MLATICLTLLAATNAPPTITTAITDTTIEVGDGSVIEHGTVVFAGNVIVAVGNTVAVPAGAVVVDGRGKVTSPGFVAVDSQVGLVAIGMETGLGDSSTTGNVRAAFRAADGFNPLAVSVPVDREEGVTSAVLSPSGNTLINGQGCVVELRTSLAARPDPDAPAAMFGRYDGHVAAAFGGSRSALALALRSLIDDTRLYQRQRAAFDRGELRALSVEMHQLQAFIPVVEGKLPLVMRADRATDILALLDVAAREKLKLMIVGGAESWLVADRLKAAKVPVVLVPSASGSISFDALHARDDLAAVLVAAGVEIVITSWASDNGTTRLRQEAGIAVQNGLSRAAAIAAIAAGPAALFSVRHDDKLVGKLVAGGRANVVLWSGDPLEVLSIAEQLWVAGEAQTTPSRQRQLAEKYRPLVAGQPATAP